MSQTKNGRISWTDQEVEASDNLKIMRGGGRLAQAPAAVLALYPELAGKWFLLSFIDNDPWFEFLGQLLPPPPPALPVGFAEIYGQEPIAQDSKTQEGLRGLWRQELGFWYDNHAPDWATPIMQATAAEYFAAHGMGRLLPWRLKVPNGDFAEFVGFPDANPHVRGPALPIIFWMHAEMVYRLAQQGVAAYQHMLKDAGFVIPIENQVEFFSGPRITHAG